MPKVSREPGPALRDPLDRRRLEDGLGGRLERADFDPQEIHRALGLIEGLSQGAGAFAVRIEALRHE